MKSRPRTNGLEPLGFGGGFRDPDRGLRELLKGRGKLALMALGTVMAVTFAMAWNPPTSSVHKFTSASDYRADNESGCTNSGAGCHGEESSYADFNDYHPDATCTTCHDYQGVGCIPCHSPREHECALCHDGSMRQAPDRVRITDPYPSGHYRETTHTAMGTAMDTVVRAVPDGRAKATCDKCHSRDLRQAHAGVPTVDGSDYGTDIGCGECHNDVRAFGQAEVLSDWPGRSCEACHKLGSSSPMHATEELEPVDAEDEFGCTSSGAGCHHTSDLHELHGDRPKSCSGSAEKGEPGCHDVEVEAHLPTATSCGGTGEESCHRSGDSRGYAHKKTAEVHSPETTRPASDQSFNAVGCGECHLMRPDGYSLVAEHERATSEVGGDTADTCANCHNNEGSIEVIAEGWPGRDSKSACADCHDGQGIESPHEADLTAAHDSSASKGCAATGPGCHPGSDISAIDTASEEGLHASCVRCHDATPSDGNVAYSPGKRSCGEGRDCHDAAGAYDPGTSIHRRIGETVDGRDREHHSAGREQMGDSFVDAASGVQAHCGSCHSSRLATEHTRSDSTIRHNACAGCHNASAGTARTVKAGWTKRDTTESCAACHDGSSAPVRHERIDGVHQATEYSATGQAVKDYCSGNGCHETADVRKLHAAAGCMLAGCHGDTGVDSGGGARLMSCGGSSDDSCHAATGKHAEKTAEHTATELDSYGTPSPGTCQRDGCHLTVDTRAIHEGAGCRTPDCHGGPEPKRMTCGGQDGNESSCHAGSARHADRHARHQAQELDAYGDVSPGTCQRAGCHETVDVRVLHDTTFCETSGCHVKGGPTYMSCGGGDEQAACHAGASRHPERHDKHQAIEYDSSGSAEPGACQTAGCHTSVDVRVLHTTAFCETSGCHVTDGPTYMSCGGGSGQPNCHLGYGEGGHSQDHSADLSGEVDGIEYGVGENEGCLGTCHDESLVAEHRIRWLGGGLEGAGQSVCAMCHASAEGAGEFAQATAVTEAISRGDRRCIACHSQESDGPDGLAAPPATCAPTAGLASVESVLTASAARAPQAPGSTDPDLDAATAQRKPTVEGNTGGTEPSHEETAPAPDGGSDERETGEPGDAEASEPDAGDAGRGGESDPECMRETDETTKAASIESAFPPAERCAECHEISD